MMLFQKQAEVWMTAGKLQPAFRDVIVGIIPDVLIILLVLFHLLFNEDGNGDDARDDGCPLHDFQ